MRPSLGRRLLVAAGVAALAGGGAGIAMGQVLPGGGKETRPPVYVEDSPAAQESLDKSRDLRKQGRLPEAAAAYQRLLDQHGQRLLSAGEATYTDAARLAVRDLLADAPLLGAYRDSQGAAARMAISRARGSDDEIGLLEDALSRYPLTRAGLDAGLRLAALLLERARPIDAAAALHRLADHPDLADAGSRWRLLSLAAALQSGQATRAKALADALRPTADADTLRTVEQWLTSTRPPAQLPVITPGAPAPSSPLPDQFATALWRIDLAEATGDGTPMSARVTGTLGVQPSAALLVPVGRGERMWLNNGSVVAAVDISSGRLAWTHNVEDSEIDAMIRPWQRPGTRFSDPRGVAALGDRVAAVVGATSSIAPMRNATTAVVCLDESRGNLLWRVEPKTIDESLAAAFFHGTPLAVENRFIVMLRRSQMLGFQDAYVAALDARTGRPLWRRYLASSSSINRQTSRFLAQATLDGHWLYVIDNLGSVARIDSRSGGVDWLRTLTDMNPPPGDADQAARLRANLAGRTASSGNWIPTAPIVTAAGLVVPPPSGVGPAVLLDAASGKRIRELTEPAWVEADYLLPLNGDVLSLGAMVRRVRGTTLEVGWTAAMKAEPDARPRGLAAISGDRLALPLADRMVVLDLNTGAETTSAKIESPSNLMATEGQLLVTQNETVRCYMEWEAASQHLRARAAANPRDPRPALSLAYLAAASDKRQAMLEALDLATTAASAAPPTDRQAVFRILLGMAENTRTISAENRALIFDRLGGVTTGASDDAARYLALGVHLASTGKPAEAAEQFQTVLMDPSLAAQTYERGAGLRQAGLEAQMRLGTLIRDHGTKVYSRFDALAAQRLAELSATGAEPATFIESARQFPMSRSVPGLLAAAGDALDNRGDSTAALTQYRRAYGAGSDAHERARIVGRMAQVHARLRQPRLAIQWLERLRRDHPDAAPWRDGKPVSTDEWIAQLARMPSGEMRLASLRLPLAQPQVLEGRLLELEAQPDDTRPHDRLFLWQSGRLMMRYGAALELAWEVSLPESPALQWADGQCTLLVEPAAGALRNLDSGSGRTQWRLDLRPLLEQAGGDAQRQAMRPAEERRFVEQLNPMGMVIRNRKPVPLRQALGGGENSLMLRMNDTVAVVADRKGRAAGLDRKSGKLLWRSLLPLERVTHMEMDNDTLALAGLLTVDMEDQGGAMIVLDPQTGEARCPTIEEKSNVNWIGLGGDGMVAYLAGAELVGRHAVDGSVAWRLSLPAESANGPAWFGGDLLLLREGAMSVAVIDPAQGRVVNRLNFTASNQATVLSPLFVENAWHVLTGTQLITLGHDGTVRWRDSIPWQGRRPLLQVAGADHLVVLAASGLPAPPRAAIRIVPGNADPANPAKPIEQDALRRMALAIRNMNGLAGARAEIEIQGDAVNEPQPEPPGAAMAYRLYVLDRRSGALLEERDLGPVRDPIETSAATFLDGRLVFTTRGTAIVIPSAAKSQGVVP